ncbi:MAG: hypothetical protein EOM91_10540 [Sphingobacteriia bacterium]|nr:hypothetical protein [Sphingobacteriia bacterium]NCC41639.1 hypothetical protein [Gammaproteobacteria bacterium]
MKRHTLILACSLIAGSALADRGVDAQPAHAGHTLPGQSTSETPAMSQDGRRHLDGLPVRFCSSVVAGSYLLSFDFSDGSFSSRGILSLFKDGMLVVNDSSQGGLEDLWDPFTSGQGAWRCLGSSAFHAVSVNFNIPGELDPDGGLARLDFQGQVDRSGRIHGSVELRRFELHQDPFNDVLTPTDVFTFNGQRIEATFPQ